MPLATNWVSPGANFSEVDDEMNTVWTEKELAELATATAVDVGYEAVRWWIDETNPTRLRVEARPVCGALSTPMLLIAFLPERESLG
jgi:hypothetical protein